MQREGDDGDSDVTKSMFRLAACLSSVWVSHAKMDLAGAHMVCVYDLHVLLICLFVFALRELCVKGPVPEGSRQSRGASSSSMTKIH